MTSPIALRGILLTVAILLSVVGCQTATPTPTAAPKPAPSAPTAVPAAPTAAAPAAATTAPAATKPAATAASAPTKISPDLKPTDPAKLAWGGSPQGGTSYVAAAAASAVLTKYLKNVSVTAVSTSGTVENTRRVNAGEFQLSGSTSDVAFFGYKGGREFEAPLPKVRFVANERISAEHILVPTDSPIKSLADLKGKRISSTPGWGATTFVPAILEAAGLKKDDYQMIPLAGGDGANALRDGTVDAVMWAFGVPAASVTELATTKKGARFLPVDDKTAAVIKEKTPYWFITKIPAKSYPGQTQDIATVATTSNLIASADLSDALAYNITKILYLYADEIRKAVPAEEALGNPSMVLGPPAPLHPGAEQFYREAGLVK